MITQFAQIGIVYCYWDTDDLAQFLQLHRKKLFVQFKYLPQSARRPPRNEVVKMHDVDRLACVRMERATI